MFCHKKRVMERTHLFFEKERLFDDGAGRGHGFENASL